MNSDFSLAVHALVYLKHRGELLTSEALAENICTNPARVRRVMARLRKAGLVELRGWRESGGYFFHKDADEVDLNAVAAALEVRFVSESWHSGDPCMECKIASGIAGVMDGIYSELDDLCKSRLSRMTITDVEDMLFNSGEKNNNKEAQHGGIRDNR